MVRVVICDVIAMVTMMKTRCGGSGGVAIHFQWFGEERKKKFGRKFVWLWWWQDVMAVTIKIRCGVVEITIENLDAVEN